MENRQQFPNYDYSTLEVAPSQSPPIHQSYPQNGYQQPYALDPANKSSPQPSHEGRSLPETVSTQLPEVVPTSDLPEAMPKQQYAQYGQPGGPKPEYTPYGEQQHNQPPPPPLERRIWGLKRKTFFIVLGIVLTVVVAAVVGGAVGATVNQRSNSGGGNSTSGGGGGGGGGSGGGGSAPGATKNSPVLSTSKISAINWTDSSQVSYEAVFWQANTTDLMMSIWDSKNKTWALTNITANLGAASISYPPKKSTPLAAAARAYPWTVAPLKQQFGIALFYLSDKNIVTEIYSEDIRGASWSYGDLTTAQKDLEAGADSQLSAWWSLCNSKNCTDDVLLVYEDKTQTLTMANGTDWHTTPVLRNIAVGASLAITGMTPDYGTFGPAAYSPRVYYDSSNILSELMWSPPGPWYYGSTLVRGLSNQPPQIAVTSYPIASDPTQGLLGVLVVGAFSNGSLFVNYWNNRTWTDPTPPLMQGKLYTNFTAVSVFQGPDLRFVGLTNESEIHSFTLDGTNLLSWNYAEAVKIS